MKKDTIRRQKAPNLTPILPIVFEYMDGKDMYLTEAENIKKRWQEYTEELYKKKKKKIFFA